MLESIKVFQVIIPNAIDFQQKQYKNLLIWEKGKWEENFSITINSGEKWKVYNTSGDDRNEVTADCLSLGSVCPSIRTKPTPFSHINSWMVQKTIFIVEIKFKCLWDIKVIKASRPM